MKVDLGKPVEIADGVFWVGGYLQGDIFQCHTYLVVGSDGAVLIDPGSLLTYEETLRKIKYLVDLSSIKYIVCHHQDPDITASLPRLLEEFTASSSLELYLVTHWRTYFLLKHLALPVSYYLVDQHDFRLEFGDRSFRFLLTPYMHYPGNIVTYEERSRVLFSSDIFGGWMEEWDLFADETYPEKMRAYHEVYMPCREVVLYTLERLKRLDIEVIAPQHGSIIRGRDLIKRAMEALETFDYGILVEHQSLEAVKREVLRRSILREVERYCLEKIYLSEVVPHVVRTLRTSYKLKDIFVCVDGERVCFCYSHGRGYSFEKGDVEGEHEVSFTKECEGAKCTVHFVFEEDPGGVDREFFESIASYLVFAARRDLHIKKLEMRASAYKKAAMRDPLTGACTRMAIEEIKRGSLGVGPACLIMLDIDNFKLVNDRYGHLAGDRILKRLGEEVQSCLRKNDVFVRYGGDEFVVVLSGADMEVAKKVAERIKRRLESIRVNDHHLSVSMGVAQIRDFSMIDDAIRRADEALYRAKRAGKSRIEVFEDQ